MRSWALLFFPRGKKSNQKNRAAVCELVLRTGTLRSSARRGTARNSLRSDTRASSPPPDLRCSARFKADPTAAQ